MRGRARETRKRASSSRECKPAPRAPDLPPTSLACFSLSPLSFSPFPPSRPRNARTHANPQITRLHMSTPPPGRTLLIPVEDTEVREETRAARWHQLFARSRCLLPLSRPTQTQTLQKFQACVSALKWTLAHVYRGGRERTERERERDEETRAESGARPTQGAEKKDAGPHPPNLPPLPTRPTRPPARPDRQPGRPGAPRRTQQQAPRGDPSGPTSLILSPSPHPFQATPSCF